ncbi:endoribonuclease Dicer [Platysternon megacephalum]|uniref:Endoribonuclease Dicer n=1 Tax=Platysternon megacephalum TaxID=55544 RepID=A0A4D9EZ74_9SAUR|nr:endoribonuclease Dicer [Platysternon megacephalum]
MFSASSNYNEQYKNVASKVVHLLIKHVAVFFTIIRNSCVTDLFLVSMLIQCLLADILKGYHASWIKEPPHSSMLVGSFLGHLWNFLYIFLFNANFVKDLVYIVDHTSQESVIQIQSSRYFQQVHIAF